MEPPEKDSFEPPDEEIALCAYRLWLQEGCPHGRDKEHWLKARKQLVESRAEENAEAGATRDSWRGVPGSP